MRASLPRPSPRPATRLQGRAFRPLCRRAADQAGCLPSKVGDHAGHWPGLGRGATRARAQQGTSHPSRARQWSNQGLQYLRLWTLVQTSKEKSWEGEITNAEGTAQSQGASRRVCNLHPLMKSLANDLVCMFGSSAKVLSPRVSKELRLRMFISLRMPSSCLLRESYNTSVQIYCYGVI